MYTVSKNEIFIAKNLVGLLLFKLLYKIICYCNCLTATMELIKENSLSVNIDIPIRAVFIE